MTTESNVRKVLTPDMAFDRWWAEHDFAGRRDIAEHLFRAGYEACLRDLAEATTQPVGPR